MSEFSKGVRAGVITTLMGFSGGMTLGALFTDRGESMVKTFNAHEHCETWRDAIVPELEDLGIDTDSITCQGVIEVFPVQEGS